MDWISPTKYSFSILNIFVCSKLGFLTLWPWPPNAPLTNKIMDNNSLEI